MDYVNKENQVTHVHFARVREAIALLGLMLLAIGVLSGCIASKTLDCGLLTNTEIGKIIGARFLKPEVTITPKTSGDYNKFDCTWFREGIRGVVTKLDLSVSTLASRARAKGVSDAARYLEFQRGFLARDGVRVNVGDEAWVVWYDVNDYLGNGVLLMRKGGNVFTLVLTDQDELKPGVKELERLARQLANKL